MTLGTRRLIAGLALLLTGLLIGHYITAEQFGSLFQSLLSLFAS